MQLSNLIHYLLWHLIPNIPYWISWIFLVGCNIVVGLNNEKRTATEQHHVSTMHICIYRNTTYICKEYMKPLRYHGTRYDQPPMDDVNNRADEKENNTFFTINFRSILTNIIKWRFIVSTDGWCYVVLDHVVFYCDYVLYMPR